MFDKNRNIQILVQLFNVNYYLQKQLFDFL